MPAIIQTASPSFSNNTEKKMRSSGGRSNLKHSEPVGAIWHVDVALVSEIGNRFLVLVGIPVDDRDLVARPVPDASVRVRGALARPVDVRVDGASCRHS